MTSPEGKKRSLKVLSSLDRASFLVPGSKVPNPGPKKLDLSSWKFLESGRGM